MGSNEYRIAEHNNEFKVEENMNRIDVAMGSWFPEIREYKEWVVIATYHTLDAAEKYAKELMKPIKYHYIK